MSFTLQLSDSTEIHVDARIRIVAEAPPPPGPFVRLTTRFEGITTKHIGATDMAYTLRNDQQIGLAIAYVDADGNPAAIDGEVSWSSSDENVARVDPTSGDEVTLIAENNGTCQIRAEADADLGSGVRSLITLLDVEVVSGEAVAGVITPVGEPMPKP
jgi:hypothetical protein